MTIEKVVELLNNKEINLATALKLIDNINEIANLRELNYEVEKQKYFDAIDRICDNSEAQLEFDFSEDEDETKSQ